VASLRGRSIRERVKELINIAHPNFRDYLRSEAERNQIW
jgi:acyl-CoA hydrolase